MKKLVKLMLINLLSLVLCFAAGCFEKDLYQVNGGVYGSVITEYTGTISNVTTPIEIDGAIITEIGASCYAYNIYINKVEITNNIKTIRTCAFFYCTEMTNIYIPSSVKVVEPYAFHGAKNIKFVYYEGTEEEFLALFEEDEDNLNSNKELFDAKIIYNYTKDNQDNGEL